MKWIKKIGVEIECAIENDIYHEIDKGYINPDGFEMGGDGSINSDEGCCVEFRSLPTSSLPILLKRLKKLYKYIVEINKTMGLHIHISLKQDDYYYRLCSKRFYDFFFDKLTHSNIYKRNKELRNRINKNNHYAQKIKKYKVIDSQLVDFDDDRYRIINFCKSKHGTIEFRIYPAMKTAEEVLEAIEFTIKVVSEWIKEKKYLRRAVNELTLKKRDERVRVHYINEITDSLLDKKIEVK